MSRKRVPGLGDGSPSPIGGNAPKSPVWERPVNPKQLAHFLQVSPRTVKRLMKKRDFPRLDVAGQTRFIPNDVIAFLRRGK